MNGRTLFKPIVENRIGLSLIVVPISFRFTEEVITKGACGVAELEIFKDNFDALVA